MWEATQQCDPLFRQITFRGSTVGFILAVLTDTTNLLVNLCSVVENLVDCHGVPAAELVLYATFGYTRPSSDHAASFSADACNPNEKSLLPTTSMLLA